MKRMKILIAYDGSSHADAALDDLVRAGMPQEAEALVISVADVWMWPPPTDDARGLRAEELDIISLNKARAQSEQAVEEARKLAIQASERVKAAFPLWKVDAEGYGDSPAWAVIKKAEEWGADLVVVGSQGRSALSRLILGSVSQKVLYEAHCSVRVARANSERRDSPPRIIIGVDGSPGAEAAVDAVAVRNWPVGTEVHLITALGSSMVPAWKLIQEYAQSEQVWAHQMLESLAAGMLGTGLKVSTFVRQGDPKRVLLDEAEKWQADSIFVGARGLRRIERFLLGSVSAGVAAQANCSVEVVRTPEASSPDTGIRDNL
jgi:nucleotide-binding universal stress UspA family protein